MTRPIINLDELDFVAFGHGAPAMPGGGVADEKFAAQLGQIGERIGAREIGCNLTVVPPGKRAFPFHSHRANEEVFVVLAGAGEVRIGAARHPLRVGDVVACPTGGPETAHQIINTGNEDLRYLAFSTKHSPDVAEYPDSGKFAVRAAGEGGPPFRFVGRAGDARDYWDGE
jgi:uncharacterized cupin superfamily protein